MQDREQEKEERKTQFKVTDRRKFTSEGELVSPPASPAGAVKEPAPPPSASRPEEPRRSEGGRETSRRRAEGPPSIDFSSFLVSLATSAMAYLGEVPDPQTGRTHESLEGAQQMIQILGLLQEKTKGNLDPEEDRLLDDLLYELRMKYLAKSKVISL